MPRLPRPLLLASLLVLVGPPAVAAPFRYVTAGRVFPPDLGVDGPVRFEGTSGTFEPGSTIALGRFVVEPPESGPDAAISDMPFALEVRVPELDRTIRSGPTTVHYTEIQGSVRIHGRLSGVIGRSGSELVADFDEVIPGGLGPYILLPDWRFTFPVPVEDLELPGRQVLFSGAGPSSSAVAIRAVPEPATWATWGLIGSGALLVGRRRRA